MSKEQVLDKGVRQKSTKSVNLFIVCSAFCPGPMDSEKQLRIIYTSGCTMARHVWRVDKAAGHARRNQNACLSMVKIISGTYGIRCELVKDTCTCRCRCNYNLWSDAVMQVRGVRRVGKILAEKEDCRLSINYDCYHISWNNSSPSSRMLWFSDVRVLVCMYLTNNLKYFILGWYSVGTWRYILKKILENKMNKYTVCVCDVLSMHWHLKNASWCTLCVDSQY